MSTSPETAAAPAGPAGVPAGSAGVPGPAGGAVSPKRLMQGLIGLAALVLLAGGALLAVLNTKITALEAKATNQEAQVGSSQQVTKRYQETFDSYQETLSRIRYLESSVAQKAFVPTLLKQLQTLAQQTHLKVNAVRPGQVLIGGAGSSPSGGGANGGDGKGKGAAKQAPAPYDTMDVSVEMAGTYADTVTFLYRLTQFPKIVTVNSVQFSPQGSSAGPGAPTVPTVTTSLHLTAIIFHDDPAAPAAGTQAAGSIPGAVGAVVPAAADGSVAGAAGRATRGALAAQRAAVERGRIGAGTL